MSLDIVALLAQDGIVNGAVYAMIALGCVLVFNVSRVVFVSFGDLIAYAALTLATLQAGRVPGNVWLLVGLAFAACLVETVDLVRRRRFASIPRALGLFGLAPMLPVAAAVLLAGRQLPMLVQILLAIALVLPLGPLIYRTVFQPMANASVLALLLAAVAIHFVFSGLALLFFGAEGYRTDSYVSGEIDVMGTSVSVLSMVIVAAVVCTVLVLHLVFEYSTFGKALRATAINPVGARVVGIRTTQAGSLAFLIATFMAALSGVLIGPLITVYYDTGFLVGLKGFVGAVVGGFVSYPLALGGALAIGLIESFSSFYSSGFKDAIVFATLIPIVLLRWFATGSAPADAEEEQI